MLQLLVRRVIPAIFSMIGWISSFSNKAVERNHFREKYIQGYVKFVIHKKNIFSEFSFAEELKFQPLNCRKENRKKMFVL